jgi:hypothetical protein
MPTFDLPRTLSARPSRLSRNSGQILRGDSSCSSRGPRGRERGRDHGAPRAPAPRSCSRRGRFSRGRACRRDRGVTRGRVRLPRSARRRSRAGTTTCGSPRSPVSRHCSRRGCFSAVSRFAARAVAVVPTRTMRARFLAPCRHGFTTTPMRHQSAPVG